jgi:anthranilate phosphoribosyltransferase
MDIRDAIHKVVNRQNLSEAQAGSALAGIMDGQATPAQIAAFLTALRMKGETVEEIVGFIKETRKRAKRIAPRADHLVDVCGTGGDDFTTFNISSTSAFVVAAGGGHVAKHGGRTYRHRSGSADVVEAMGVNLDASPEVVQRCIEEVGIGFLFAPNYHPAVKHAAAPRREIGLRTVLNVVSTLCNPADVPHMLVGVYDPALTETVADVLRTLGARRALVVHGAGMDELTTLGASKITELRDGALRTYIFDATTLGIRPPDPSALAGGTPEDNARIAVAVLQGERGPRRDIVQLNAAAGLTAAGVAADLREGYEIAGKAIRDGSAYAKLEALRVLSHTNGHDG